MPKIKRAVISVTDKTRIVELGRELNHLGVEVISTGGTATVLKEGGVSVVQMSDFTGFPEIMGGRVKTLHPRIHGGFLAVRDNAEHRKDMEANGLVYIDMLVCNLYAFESTIAKPGCTLQQAIEDIDIGGPSMLRSAAKNYRYLTVITDPADYDLVLGQMMDTGGVVGEDTNFRLACKVFERTHAYDGAIAAYLRSQLTSKD